MKKIKNKMMDIEEIDYYLPKWPQCVIFGDDISEEQTRNIIRRTDIFFSKLDYTLSAGLLNLEELEIIDSLNLCIENIDRFKKEIGFINTNYIINSWVSCTWICGCHGWCNPTGLLGFRNNIGKYPVIEYVLNDWKSIAKEFPFLNLTCTLMSDEEGVLKRRPIVTLEVNKGSVKILKSPLSIFDLRFRGVSGFINWQSLSKAKRTYFSLDEIKEIWKWE